MFFGEYAHQLDDKNRIRIPSKFKQELGKDYVFCKGIDGVINVYPSSVIEAQAKTYESVNAFDEEAQDALMEFMSSIFQANEDKQGRVIIPEDLIAFANLGKDVVTVGMGNRLCIMSKKLREEKRGDKTHSENMKVLTEKLKS